MNVAIALARCSMHIIEIGSNIAISIIYTINVVFLSRSIESATKNLGQAALYMYIKMLKKNQQREFANFVKYSSI